MIKKLKIKFICLAMVTILLLLSVVVVGINALNYRSVVLEADKTLDFLADNEGDFPVLNKENGKPPKHKGNRLPNNMSPETPYESRYFSVLLTASGEIKQIDISRIASVDSDDAKSFAYEAFESGENRGFTDEFRYSIYNEKNGVRIIFLNCNRNFKFFYRFLWISILAAFAGFVLISLVIGFFANKIVRPVAEGYEKQRRFITDAGHEIKTPLTIINANVDILEMDMEGNECIAEIRQQTERLTMLTNDLVYLARLEETENKMKKIELPLSELVLQTSASFKALAQTQGKIFKCDVQPMLSVEGDFKALQQLVNVLMDNALKYSPDGGVVEIRLMKQNRSVQLSVSNTTVQAVESDELKNIFDRFYRPDRSRNSETGGHGIGLAVAKAIVDAHNGKIMASTREGGSFDITVSLPT